MAEHHCWMGYIEWVEEHHGVKYWWLAPGEAIAPIIGDGNSSHGFYDATCFEPAGHVGPHVWTPDSEVVISFPADPPMPAPERALRERHAAAGHEGVTSSWAEGGKDRG